MRQRVLTVACVVGITSAVASLTRGDVPLTAKLVLPSQVMIRLIIEKRWTPRLDEGTQRLSVLAGAGWDASNPGWKRARGVMTSRVTRATDEYLRGDQLAHDLQTVDAKVATAQDRQALVHVLNGPWANWLIRKYAFTAYASEKPPEGDGAAIGSAQWLDHLKKVKAEFDERVDGTAVPAADLSHGPDLALLRPGGAWAPGSPVDQFLGSWSLMLSSAADRIDGRVNGLIFDEHDKIRAELEAAMASH